MKGECKGICIKMIDQQILGKLYLGMCTKGLTVIFLHCSALPEQDTGMCLKINKSSGRLLNCNTIRSETASESAKNDDLLFAS